MFDIGFHPNGKSLPHINGSAYVFYFFILLFFPSWTSEITHYFGERLKSLAEPFSKPDFRSGFFSLSEAF